MAEEEKEKHEIDFSVPDLAEFFVAGILRGMVFRDATAEVIAEPCRPCGDEDAGDKCLDTWVF